MRSRLAGFRARCRRIAARRATASRGATLVEYALGVGLIAVVIIGAVQAVSDNAEDSLDDRGDTIGHPVYDGVTTTTTGGGGGGGGGGTTPSTTPSYTGSIEGSCNGSNGNKNVCSFTLNPDPTPVVPTWSIDPPTGFTGTPPAVTFIVAGTRSVRANVDGTVVQRVVECTTNGQGANQKVTCNLK